LKGGLVDQKKKRAGVLAFFPVVAISTNLSTIQTGHKENKKS
jgi:hypothetical protein